MSEDAEAIASWLEADAEACKRTLAAGSGSPEELRLRIRLARKFARHIREGRPWDPQFGGSPRPSASSTGT